MAADIIAFPRKPEHIENDFDRLLAEFTEATGITGDPAQGREILRRHSVLYSLLKELQR